MPTWKNSFDDWLRTHNGVIGATQLIGLGCSKSTLQRMVARQDLLRMQSGVYRGRQWPDDELQRMTAICVRNPEAVIAFTTAARLWGFRNVEDREIHVLVPHGASPALAGATVHRCRRIDAVDIVQRPDGIRVTSPPRTLFDGAFYLGLDSARSVLEQMLHDRRCTIGTVVDTFVRLAHPHRLGTRTMIDVIASRPKWRKALHSDLEQRVLGEIERQSLPTPAAQCPVALPAGQTIHLDFGWPEWKVGLEVDDPTWHEGSRERHRDAHRDRKATTLGWAIVRISKIDVNGALADAICDVATILATRQAA
ncbi:MAG: hypothetical protein K8R99_04440 [Actinomycetia bacterium]|nr:hypothetical protein [Actinomycetes bacterium]